MKCYAPLLLAGMMVALGSGGNGAAESTTENIEALQPARMVFYVAVNGHDAWSGKLADPTDDRTDGPFLSLERARNEVRKLKNAGGAMNTSVEILVRGGTYAFKQPFLLGAEDSGTAEAPVAYRACPGEQVILSGGVAVPPEAFTPVSSVETQKRLDPAALPQVVQADLRALGIAELGDLPVKYIGAPPAPELFFNDERMTLARWPNEGWTTIARIVEPGSDHTGTRGGAFEYSGDRPSRWNAETGVWLHGYWCFDWHDDTIRIASIDREKHQITLAAPSVYGLKQGNPSPRRYYALNLLEELDRPGEYFIDRQSGLLYFWPPGPLPGARIVLSTLKAPVVSVKDATGITLRGFIMDASLASGIAVSGGASIRIQACEVRNMREGGIAITGGTKHRVEACDIHDTGAGGILLSGGDRRTLTPAGHEAINNHIWRFSIHKLTYSNAILLQGVGNRAAHNLIHDAPHQAVGINGNDHLFEYNIVHNVCMQTDDCGALYKGRNPSCRGNIIRYNFWHNIGSPMGHGNAAVYFDDGDGGETVFGNVFYRCGDPGRGSFGTVFSHGGHDNMAENNIFIECKRPLGSSPWTDARWRAAVLGNGNRNEGWNWGDRLLKEVDITKPPYTTRYPSLIGFMDPQPEPSRVNRAVRNVFVECADVYSGNWQVAADENWSTDGDPGFVNAAAGNFLLKPDSEVFSKLPGFQPIPFDRIGLVRNALRPVVPEQPWSSDRQDP